MPQHEQETSGEKTTELQAAGCLSYTINAPLSIGLETKYIHETIAGERSHPEHKFLMGPSAQIRCNAHTHLGFVSLFGVTKDAVNVEGWVVFGIDLDFGKAANDHKIHAPVSGLRN